MKAHHYHLQVEWTGNLGKGTEHYKTYKRSHLISAEGKTQTITASSDAAFRGDATCYNPEELLLASISGCHLLWYLHLCAVNQVVVLSYLDKAHGTMVEHENGSGQFTEVILCPEIVVAQAEMIAKAQELHAEAHRFCFIANSCNFPILHSPQITAK